MCLSKLKITKGISCVEMSNDIVFTKGEGEKFHGNRLCGVDIKNHY